MLSHQHCIDFVANLFHHHWCLLMLIELQVALGKADCVAIVELEERIVLFSLIGAKHHSR